MKYAYKIKTAKEIKAIDIPSSENLILTTGMLGYCGNIYTDFFYHYNETCWVRINYYTWYRKWLIFGYINEDNNFVELDDSKPVSERSQWKPDNPCVFIAMEVIDLINKAAVKCGVTFLNNSAPFWYKQRMSYDFTLIQFAENHKGKLSGIGFNKLQSLAWDSRHVEPVETLQGFYNGCCSGGAYISSEWRQEHGTYLKVGKLIRALFPDKDESTVTCIASELANLLRLRANPDTGNILVSNTPSEVYIMDSDFSSCMRNQNPCRFKIYDDLEDTQIAYIVENGELTGRALLHNKVHVFKDFQNSEVSEVIKIMDRIYAVNSDIEAVFKSYAKKNGYFYKVNQCLDCYDFVSPETDNKHNIKGYIECDDLHNAGYDEVPYIDTFGYYFEGDQQYRLVMTTSCYDDLGNFDYRCQMKDTEGADSNNYIAEGCRPKEMCYRCGERCDEDDVRWQNDSCYCEDCFDNLFSYCGYCDEYEYTEEFHTVYTRHGEEQVCEHCWENHFYYCEHCGEYFSDELINTHNDECYCNSCYDDILLAEEDEEDDEDGDINDDTDDTDDTDDSGGSEKNPSTNQFSIGDKVKIIRRGFHNFPLGTEGTVTEVTRGGRYEVRGPSFPQTVHEADIKLIENENEVQI